MMAIIKLRHIVAGAKGSALNAEDAREILGRLGHLELEIERHKQVADLCEREVRRLHSELMVIFQPISTPSNGGGK